MASREEPLTIGSLARTAGVNVETIRFYQRKGLVAEPHRPPGGIRRYAGADVARVKFIKSAQRLGFSLEEVGQMLRLDAGMQCTAAARLASRIWASASFLCSAAIWAAARLTSWTEVPEAFAIASA